MGGQTLTEVANLKGRVIRISIGNFDEARAGMVRAAMVDSFDKLAPGIKSLDGNRGYFAGIDAENHAVVNVSAWDSVDGAKQMTAFKPMVDLAQEFADLGVRFERPILNFEGLWTIEPDP
jgi:hypothetical protein